MPNDIIFPTISPDIFICVVERYFVLGDGVIRYYARDKDATSPDNQKGEMSLVNTTVVTVPGSSTQLQILVGIADG